MNKNRKTDIFIGILYSLITVILILMGFAYKLSFLGAGICSLVAYNAFGGDKSIIKYAKLKDGFKLRKNVKNK